MFSKYYKYYYFKNIFQSFLKYIFILEYIVTYIFFVQMYSNITSYEKKLIVFLAFNLFGFWPTIICKNIVKILYNNNMVEVQTWYSWKKYNATTILAPTHVVFTHLGFTIVVFLNELWCKFYFNWTFWLISFHFPFINIKCSFMILWFPKL
jgi:hypothetical protein